MLAAAPEGIATAQLLIELAECAGLERRVARRLVASALTDGSVRIAERGARIVATRHRRAPGRRDR